MPVIHRPSVPVKTVSFHVWQPCNMRCSFCFARFRDVRSGVLPEGHLTRGHALAVVTLLAEAGFQKITFAGGEPFLCPWLLDLVASAKKDGMTTSVVTNGSLLTAELLSSLPGLLDWLVISIDSADPMVLEETGRVTAGRPLSAFEYVSLCRTATRNDEAGATTGLLQVSGPRRRGPSASRWHGNPAGARLGQGSRRTRAGRNRAAGRRHSRW
jgi:radical S-adenosyl methionine domain-containing protein 2